MPGDVLADYQLSWVPLRDLMEGCEDEGAVLCFDHGQHPISGWDLGQLEMAFEAGVSKRQIMRYLRGMVKDRERGD